MKYSDQDVKEITNIVEQLKRDFPGRSLKRIIKDAEHVYLNRKTHKPTNSSPPEHVLKNIERVKKAEEDRKKQGRSLPRAWFVHSAIPASNWLTRTKSTNENSSPKSLSADSKVKPYPEKAKDQFIEGYDFELSEEVNKTEVEIFREGSIHQVTVNAYERNPEARRKCIAHYGARCCACGFDFENDTVK